MRMKTKLIFLIQFKPMKLDLIHTALREGWKRDSWREVGILKWAKVNLLHHLASVLTAGYVAGYNEVSISVCICVWQHFREILPFKVIHIFKFKLKSKFLFSEKSNLGVCFDLCTYVVQMVNTKEKICTFFFVISRRHGNLVPTDSVGTGNWCSVNNGAIKVYNVFQSTTEVDNASPRKAGS